MLIGTWHLVEWDCTLDGLYHSHPFGRDAQGMLIYAEDGYMSAILSLADRAPFARANLRQGSESEKIAAIEGYVSYAGRYRTEGNCVIHSVELSLLPNWIGTELIREMAWTSEQPAQLILTTLPQTTRSGKVVVNRLRWRRSHNE